MRGGKEIQVDESRTLSSTLLWRSKHLDSPDRDALSQAVGKVRHLEAGTEIVAHDGGGGALHVLLDGWAARYKLLDNGSRSIPALLTPGDICDAEALPLRSLGTGVRMLTGGTVAMLPRQRLNELLASRPAVAKALLGLAFVENSILSEWAASLARRSAVERLAHLLCELLVRLWVVGQADGLGFHLPLTQDQIADVLGLTSIHVNRTLRSLRAAGAVSMRGRHLTIHDWPGLSASCGFDPGYLHLEMSGSAFLVDALQTGRVMRAVEPPKTTPL